MARFFEKVYRIIAQIPEGKVATYGQIAAYLGDPMQARTVGWALHSCPPRLKLPCHRVVNRVGELSGRFAFGDPRIQRERLEAEGVSFDLYGRVDLERHLWIHDGVEVEETDDRPQTTDHRSTTDHRL